jgi:hypothetical protein
MEQIQVIKMKVVDGELVSTTELRMVEVEPEPTDEEVKYYDVVEQLDNAFADVWEYAEDGWGKKGSARMSHQFIFFAERYSQDVEPLPIDFADWEEVGERREKGWLSDGSADVDGTFS